MPAIKFRNGQPVSRAAGTSRGFKPRQSALADLRRTFRSVVGWSAESQQGGFKELRFMPTLIDVKTDESMAGDEHKERPDSQPLKRRSNQDTAIQTISDALVPRTRQQAHALTVDDRPLTQTGTLVGIAQAVLFKCDPQLSHQAQSRRAITWQGRDLRGVDSGKIQQSVDDRILGIHPSRKGPTKIDTRIALADKVQGFVKRMDVELKLAFERLHATRGHADLHDLPPRLLQCEQGIGIPIQPWPKQDVAADTRLDHRRSAQARGGYSQAYVVRHAYISEADAQQAAALSRIEPFDAALGQFQRRKQIARRRGFNIEGERRDLCCAEPAHAEDDKSAHPREQVIALMRGRYSGSGCQFMHGATIVAGSARVQSPIWTEPESLPSMETIMRPIILPVLLCLTLIACNQPSPDQTSSAPANVAAPIPAQTTAATETAVEPPAMKAPEGDCGDQSALASEERMANTPKWSLASEQDNFGFDVFRSDSEDGEFAKLNQDPILGAGTTDETQKYSWRDDTIDPCKDYWYYVDSISTSGVREKMTPTFKAPAKHSPRSQAAE